MRTLTRVEKYRKLREEIARMPDPQQEKTIIDQTLLVRIKNTQFEESNNEISKKSRSTTGIGIDEIMAGVNASEEDSSKSLSPIAQQKRKETIRVVILLSILLVLLIVVVILGIIAF